MTANTMKTDGVLSPKNTPAYEPLNSSMNKFVAGSFRPEKSEFMAPGNSYWATNQMPNA